MVSSTTARISRHLLHSTASGINHIATQTAATTTARLRRPNRNLLRIQRGLLFRVDPQVLHGVRDALAIALALFFELIERGQCDALGVDFKMPAERATAFAAPHAVGAQSEKPAGDPFADLLG